MTGVSSFPENHAQGGLGSRAPRWANAFQLEGLPTPPRCSPGTRYSTRDARCSFTGRQQTQLHRDPWVVAVARSRSISQSPAASQPPSNGQRGPWQTLRRHCQRGGGRRTVVEFMEKTPNACGTG